MTNSRFAVAIHTMALLAEQKCGPVSSDMVARSVKTNPVVIRRLIANLREAGLVATRPGRGGGLTLGREPHDITLLDIYRAVERDDLIAMHDGSNPLCPIAREVSGVLRRYTAAAERALEQSLSSTTLRDLVATLRRRIRRNA